MGIKTALLLLVMGTASYGDLLVVPNAQATVNGNSPNAWTGSPFRVQEVVGNGQFTGPIVITGLYLRAVPGTGPVNINSSLWKITMSTTAAYPNTSAGHTLPSPTFASNTGPDAVLVYNGPVSVSSNGCQSPGPCPFDMVLPLSTPFAYDPNQGRLLIDLMMPTAAGAGNLGTVDGVSFPSPGGPVATVSGDPAQTSGGVDTNGITFGLQTATTTYYVPQISFGGGWQTTLTYVNYSPLAVRCQTSFYDDSGAAQSVPFGGPAAPTRTNSIAAGGTVHQQTTSQNATSSGGWAIVVCNYPVKASVLFRNYNSQAVAQGEASVNATTTPASAFVTFAETKTGIAFANPSSTTTANVTITALNSAGLSQGSTIIPLPPNGHGAANIGPLLGLSNFTGSVQITSSSPIVSLSLNAEAFPVLSGLPPGDLPTGTPLALGH